ncbi:MAG TPA: formate/nitrite transporter family protein [Rhizomicrobium sp.]|jgi:formate/nitrite transporter FocA (FNT family)
MAQKKGADGGGEQPNSKKEIGTIEERARLQAPVIYGIVRHEGQSELERPVFSLWWSGLAAGLSISFSLLTQALFYVHLPDTQWRPLLVSIGYPVGFLMVVLARQQLFTESTLTAVLPFLAEFNLRNFALLARLWAVVLVANIAGTLFAAAFCTFVPVIAPDMHAAMLDISAKAMSYPWWPMLLRGISAGFLIAAMVWLIPSAEGTQFHIVFVMTYLVGLGNFAHIIAGSMESFMLLFSARMGIVQLLWSFMLPVLIGNVIGGTALFALISYAQVVKEM